MNYWLFKSEPTAYSINDLSKEKNKVTAWDGVRNYQARNFMRDIMKVGDDAFFYHSSCKEPGIVGIIKIVREAYVDSTAFDPEDHHYDARSTRDNPSWMMVDVALVEKFNRVIPLFALKRDPKLSNMVILKKGNRLSITPLTVQEWRVILAMR